MAMTWVWTVMVLVSVLFGILTGRADAVASAAIEGAQAAITLSIATCGVMCLWSGIMEVMRVSGISDKLTFLLKHVISRLFPSIKNDPDTSGAIAGNISANFLGLGNAATPLGIKAAKLMAKRVKNGVASDDLCTLVVLNTASIQLIPATVASVRAAAGAAAPFDILPAVWITSAASVAVGLITAKILKKVWKAA